MSTQNYFNCTRFSMVLTEDACHLNRTGFKVTKRRPDECVISHQMATQIEPRIKCKGCDWGDMQFNNKISSGGVADLMAKTEQQVAKGNPHKYRTEGSVGAGRGVCGLVGKGSSSDASD